MKVAFIVGGFPSLSETWIVSQVTQLIARGHEVDIYARRDPGDPTVHQDVLDFGLLPHTYYFNFPTERRARLLRAARGAGRMLVRQPGTLARCLNLARYRTPYAILNSLMFVPPFLDRRYDAILCHFGGNGIDFIALKDVFPQTRFVTMFHGDDYFIGDEQGPEAFRLLRTLGDAFLVTTDCFGRATLRRYDFPDERIVTLRLSIDSKRISFRERSPSGDRLRVLSVGRLVEKKGFDVGIRAVAALQAGNPRLRVTYTIVGEGPLRPTLEALAQDVRPAVAVELVGAADGATVLQRMHEADIYLLPSTMEQAGYVLLEAQASGLPVVATRVGGVPEMVREGASAILVPAGDAARMAGALHELAQAPGRWPSMGHAGRAHVEEQHDVSRVTPQLEAALCPSKILRG